MVHLINWYIKLYRKEENSRERGNRYDFQRILLNLGLHIIWNKLGEVKKYVFNYALGFS